jgi:hypothetical protein
MTSRRHVVKSSLPNTGTPYRCVGLKYAPKVVEPLSSHPWDNSIYDAGVSAGAGGACSATCGSP